MINKFTGIQWIGIHYVPLSESGKREMARESEYIYVMNGLNLRGVKAHSNSDDITTTRS